MKIFFSGVGGSGMSAIASFLADKGHRIVGSDRAFDLDPDLPLRRILQAQGITVVPQDGNGIDRSFDFVVFSTAVESDRPEVMRARQLGIPVKARPEYLSEIVLDFRTIAVAGTSGKSTAAGMLAFLMKRLGLHPNFIGGGRVKQFKTGSNPGNAITGSSDYLVIEACESDGAIINYRPLHTVILNLSLDHHTVEKTAEMFRSLLGNTGGMVFLNADDPNLLPLMRDETVTFSIDGPSDYRPENVRYRPFSTDFAVHGVPFSLETPGKHNLSNALSCIAVLSKTGIPLERTSMALREFQGIERRFDIHLNDGNHLVIDDYAHNPHKISSLMETVRRIREHVCYIFQPHGFGPTMMMKREYIEAFATGLRGSDHLILLPIFYAGGTAKKEISSHDLAEGIRSRGKSAEVAEERTDVIEKVGRWDAHVVFGARDETLSRFASEIARRLRERREPLICRGLLP